MLSVAKTFSCDIRCINVCMHACMYVCTKCSRMTRSARIQICVLLHIYKNNIYIYIYIYIYIEKNSRTPTEQRTVGDIKGHIFTALYLDTFIYIYNDCGKSLITSENHRRIIIMENIHHFFGYPRKIWGKCLITSEKYSTENIKLNFHGILLPKCSENLWNFVRFIHGYSGLFRGDIIRGNFFCGHY